MNKKVFISMLTLTVVFLVGLYVAKIFFPQEFMMSIQNEQIIKIGKYVDTHKWVYYICCIITSFITYVLYCSACSHRVRLRWYEYLIILSTSILVMASYVYDTTLSSIIQYASFIFLPALTKGNIKTAGVVYTIHIFSQWLSLQIRSLPIYLMSINYATTLLMTIECYLWLILSFVVFNYKEKKDEN